VRNGGGTDGDCCSKVNYIISVGLVSERLQAVNASECSATPGPAVGCLGWYFMHTRYPCNDWGNRNMLSLAETLRPTVSLTVKRSRPSVGASS